MLSVLRSPTWGSGNVRRVSNDKLSSILPLDARSSLGMVWGGETDVAAVEMVTQSLRLDNISPLEVGCAAPLIGTDALATSPARLDNKSLCLSEMDLLGRVVAAVGLAISLVRLDND